MVSKTTLKLNLRTPALTPVNFLGRPWSWLVGIGILVNALGLLSPVLEPDGAIYATLAKNMVLSGDYVDLMLHGKDWLDKPHFQFWMTALSFNVFGISAFAYKFPALVFWLAGLVYTYRFAQLLYNRSISRLAVLIYLSAFHLVLSNNDVRAEGYLTGLIIASVYHLYLGFSKENFLQLLIGSLLAAGAIMTKGIFTGILIFPALLSHLIWNGEWKRKSYLFASVVAFATMVFILPEIISLYFQFDTHPEKVVFGKTSVSGIRFFFWDSQFGRFFNTGPIRGEGDVTFFLHTTLWAFFPWSIPFFASLFSFFKSGCKNPAEKLSWMVVIIAFLLFSFSKFQLPHYLNIVFPFMSIQAAWFLHSMAEKSERIWEKVFSVLTALILTLIIFMGFYIIPALSWSVFVVTVLLACFFVFFQFKSTIPSRAILFLASCYFFLFLNLLVAPTLLTYQGGFAAAEYLKDQPELSSRVVMLENDLSHSFDFYYQGEVRYLSTSEILNLKVKPVVFCHSDLVSQLNALGMKTEVIKSFSHYHVSQPSADLLNARTRKLNAQHYFLVKTR